MRWALTRPPPTGSPRGSGTLGLVAALLLLAGCATRRPGAEYPWVPVQEFRAMDGVTETYMGIARKL